MLTAILIALGVLVVLAVIFYKSLWSRIGGRPWTYITREWVPKHPLATVLIAFGVGGVLGTFSTRTVLLIIAGVAAGLVLGHLFWDTSGAYVKRKLGK